MDLVPIKCVSPLRIRNPYTKEWMVVPCRKCYPCLINQANAKALHLHDELAKFPFVMFVTLTYDRNHVPCVRVGDARLYRGLSFPPVVLDDDFGLSYNYKDMALLNDDGNNQFIGVLYYKDIQLFFKKLRNIYDRKYSTRFPYGYFAVGEYGTIYKRPHYHLVFFGNEAFDERFQSAVIDSWQMHDWSRLEFSQVFKCGCDNVSNYLSGYVNSISNCAGFYGQGQIKSKTVRSKNLAFGVDAQISLRFSSCLKRGLYKSLERKILNPFEVADCSKLGVSTVDLLPKKYISSYFATPTGLCRASFDGFSSSVASALCGYSKDTVGNSIYLTNLSYKRYCKARGYVPSLASRLDYIWDAWLYRNYYKSLMIKQSMLEYEKYSDKKKYFASRINSYVDNMDKRKSKLLFRYGVLLDGFLTDENYNTLDDYVSAHEKKLLPKHFKELLNNERK